MLLFAKVDKIVISKRFRWYYNDLTKIVFRFAANYTNR